MQQLTAEKQIDICNYALLSNEGDHYPISAVTGSIRYFQELFSVVYDAIKNGPKKKARLSAEVLANTSFEFGYVYPGSLGFALAIPNQRYLLIQSEIDEAADLVFKLLQSGSIKDVLELVPKVGVAALPRVYNLCQVHSDYRLDARIQWAKNKEITNDIVVHSPEFERLGDILKETSDTDEEKASIPGTLVGLDVDTDYFHFFPVEGDEIRGKLSKDFEHDASWGVPAKYTAEIIVRTRTQYSKGEEIKSYELVTLKP